MNHLVAVVTGAARGIGKAISEALLSQSVNVVGLDIEAVRLQQTMQEFKKSDKPFTAKVVDVTDANAIKQVFTQIATEYGGVDILVNNAGTCFMTDFLDISPEELQQQTAINFDGAFYCCQQAIPLMLERPGVKKIINISSNGAYNFEVFDPTHYRTSKAALDTMTKDLARRYANDKIAVNSIAPAMTRTDLFDVVSPEVLEEAIAGMPHGEPMQPAQIAAWVAFLASPAGDCCSGNVIILNQGRDVR
ncbi:MAG: SDR family oxidoreductase [Chloroflexota bacterium]